jgi:hypothetical protein
MLNEILILKGQLSDLKKQREECEIKAENYLISIRELLSPLNEFLELELDKVFLLAKDFRALQVKARDIQTKINRIEKDLGIEE